MSIDVEDYLKKLEGRGWSFGLERIAKACRDAGDPQKSFPSVIIAGTNGKGSTARLLHELCLEHGIKSGLYTSPSFRKYNERIVVDGLEISDGELSVLTDELHEAAEKNRLTLFEFLTLLAFGHFSKSRVEIAILEAGLGGRLDATNTADSEIAVITPIGLEHTKELGPDTASIAGEKCGVIKNGAFVISAEQDDAAMKVVEETCKARSDVLRVCGRDFTFSRVKPGGITEPERFDYLDGEMIIRDIRLSLLGPHQPANASLALAAFKRITEKRGMSLSPDAVKKSCMKVRWPGRFQIISELPPVIVDGAHNPHGTRSLLATLTERTFGRTVIFVFGVLKDKDYGEMVRLLSPVAGEVIVTRPDSPRSAEPAMVNELFKLQAVESCIVEDPVVALELAKKKALDKNGIVVVCGSLFLAGYFNG